MASQLVEKLKRIGEEAMGFLVDGVYLVLWVAVQYVVDRFVVEPLVLRGFERWALQIFRFGFAFASVAPVVYRIAEEVCMLHINFKRRVRAAREQENQP